MGNQVSPVSIHPEGGSQSPWGSQEHRESVALFSSGFYIELKGSFSQNKQRKSHARTGRNSRSWEEQSSRFPLGAEIWGWIRTGAGIGAADGSI